ncbi:MAG TPA: M1 family metallopeptidase, partial [Bacteroidia bacterium]|nr:M1 family metallopeptidase [Bacteroidia bacterium]
MTSSVKNADGTRTDTWKQSLPAAPYLTMMAVSNFKVVKDRWRNIEVNYYVDPEYEMYAKDIFGNVPEILDFYSRKLGVDYPWEKSSHVVVHDYVSGAMENTSAILYGEFLQRTKRELLDGTSESTIAHEIFHHWFGDYVTCESWSNIPLNESFATYGEYLWDEYKYGREEADKGGMDDLNQYLAEAKYKQVDLIRFHYNAREDMFDRHSYSKGGRVLHMLRKYVGDDAFFASLKKYLNDNKFSPVEAHNLRLAFEAVTGQDLNWFFNQWFFAKGHPIIDISYQWNDTLKKQTVIIEQKQNLQETPLYKLPLAIDIYENGKVRREQVTLTQQKEYLFFDCNSKPQLINVDAEKQLLCAKKDNHTSDEWRYQYQHAPLFLDRYEAIDALAKGYEGN